MTDLVTDTTYQVALTVPVNGSSERALLFAKVMVDVADPAAGMMAPGWVDSVDGAMIAGWDFPTPEAAQAMHDWIASRAGAGMQLMLSVETRWLDEDGAGL